MGWKFISLSKTLFLAFVILQYLPGYSIASQVFRDDDGHWHPVYLDYENTLVTLDLPSSSFMRLQFDYHVTKVSAFNYELGGAAIRTDEVVSGTNLSALSISPIVLKSGTVGELEFSRGYSSRLADSFAPRKLFIFRFISVEYRLEAAETLEEELVYYLHGLYQYRACLRRPAGTIMGRPIEATPSSCGSKHPSSDSGLMQPILQKAFRGMNQYDAFASVQRYVDENKSSVWNLLEDCVDEVSTAIFDWMVRNSDGFKAFPATKLINGVEFRTRRDYFKPNAIECSDE